jgi:hypothetical protein
VRTGIDLVLFVVWASVGFVALSVWFVATLRLSRRRVRREEPARERSATAVNAPVPATV